MTNEKFTSEIKTLEKFFVVHCKDKHKNQNDFKILLNYNDTKLDVNCELCAECQELITYAFTHIKACPHDPKPRCRRCPEPCYEKAQWKKIAKLMRYSGMKLGFLKVKEKIKKILS